MKDILVREKRSKAVTQKLRGRDRSHSSHLHRGARCPQPSGKRKRLRNRQGLRPLSQIRAPSPLASLHRLHRQLGHALGSGNRPAKAQIKKRRESQILTAANRAAERDSAVASERYINLSAFQVRGSRKAADMLTAGNLTTRKYQQHCKGIGNFEGKLWFGAARFSVDGARLLTLVRELGGTLVFREMLVL